MTEPEYDITPAADPDEVAAVEEEKLPEFDTAFLVVTRHDGSSFATADVTSAFDVARPADLGTMWRACSEVISDIDTTKISQNVMAMMQQAGAAAQEAAEQDRIRAALANKGINVQGVRRR